MDQSGLLLVIVLCYAVAIVLVTRPKGRNNRKGEALIEGLTRLLLWVVAFRK